MERKKIYYGWFVVFGCLMITCTMVPPIMALSNKFLIQVTGELQISRSAFTLANTILQGLGIFLSPVVSARLARGNMKRIQTVSIIGFVLSYASFSLATNVIHLYISSFFTGIFFLNASLIPVSMMITNWFVKKRGLAMSIAMAGIGVGGTIFSPVITWLLGAYGWRSTYRIMALIILVLALPAALFILKKRPEDMGLLPYGSEDSTIESSSLQDSSSRDAASKRIPQKADVVFPLSIKESRTKLFFILFIFGMLCNGLINTGSLGHFPPAIEELQGPQVQALIISLYSMIGIFGKLVLGWLNDRFGVVASTAFGCITFALSFIFILFGQNISMLYIMAFLFGLGDAIGTVTPPLITSAIFGAEKYGEAYGIANSFTQIGLSLGALMVAAIYDTSGSYNTAWILLLILTLGAFAGWIGAYTASRKYCRKPAAGNTQNMQAAQ